VEISFLTTATRKEHYPDISLPRIAFAGRSNVGKSSLINSLVGTKKLARISSTPGRTQAINFFSIEGRWVFADLPGYGFAKVSKSIRAKWGPMIEEFLECDEHLRLAILIVDVRHAPTSLDLVMRDYLLIHEIPFQVIATKCDKLSHNKRQKAFKITQQTMGVEDVILYSSVTGFGKKELWHIIREV
jgi:GTP-binding protein